MVRAFLVAALVGLSACGGDDSQAPPEPPPIVAALGDSITAGALGWSPNPELREVIAERGQLTRESQWEYWAGRATDEAFRFRNCGVEGDRTDEIEARFEQCTEGAEVVVVQGGTNDLAQNRTAATAAQNILDMVRRAKDAGLRTLVTTVPPIAARYPKLASEVRRLNELIVALAGEEDVPVIDFFRLLEDPRRPDRMAGRWTDDGVHPTVDGYARIGRAAARVMEP